MASMPQDPNKPAATYAQQFIIVDKNDSVELRIPLETIEHPRKSLERTFSMVFSRGNGIVPKSPHTSSPRQVFWAVVTELTNRNIWYKLEEMTLACNKIFTLLRVTDPTLPDDECVVKFDLVLTNGRIHVETIYDAEGTSGASWQYTRFNAECKPELDQAVQILTADNSVDQMVDTILGVLEKHNFTKTDVIPITDAEGHLTNRIRVFVEDISTNF